MAGSHGRDRLVFWLMIACFGLPAITNAAQSRTARASTQTATHVSAEMVKGRLSPSASKPGDEVAVRLKEDLKSNGEVVMKKGVTITGVVKNVKRRRLEKRMHRLLTRAVRSHRADRHMQATVLPP